MATALPSACRGLDAQKQHAGLPALDTQPSAASIRLPKGAAPKVSAPAQSAASSYPDTYAASGPEPGTWKDPDPRRRSNRGSGLRIGLRARQQRLRDACGLSRLNDSWRYGLRRTRRLAADRSPQPRSAWSNRARLALLAVTHRYKPTPCLWLEQLQIEYSLVLRLGCRPRRGNRSAVKRVIAGWPQR